MKIMNNNLLKIILTILFAYITSLIVTFSSEGTYWYAHGFSIFTPALFYLIPAYALLLIIQKFNVQNLTGLILAGAVYGWIAEGVLAQVLYEDGLFGYFHASYTSLGWHALISVVIGWYYFRKWMLENKVRALCISSTLYGCFWGLWIPSFWIEKGADFTYTGIWPLWKFIVYAFSITLTFALSHWLIGKVWKPPFRFHWILNTTVSIGAAVFFSTGVFAYPIVAPVKLSLLVGLTLFILWIYKRKQEANSNLFQILKGDFPLYRTLPLFLMPVASSIIYGLFLKSNIEPVFIEEIFIPIMALSQMAIGWFFFIAAILNVLFFRKLTLVRQKIGEFFKN